MAIEVNITAKDAAIAKKRADNRVVHYVSFLEKNSVAKKDINSANLRIQPDYDYQSGKNVLKGYHAVRIVEVTLRQPGKLNDLLDDGLKGGLNDIRSVSFGLAKPEFYKDKVRKAAIDDAIHQARALATGFNSRLGSVYSARYRVSDYKPGPVVGMMRPANSPVPARETYEQPMIQFDGRVDAVFQLEPPVSLPALPKSEAQ
jgi:hypothetical protein